MIRTQVYLEEDQYYRILDVARREKKPAAKVIREAVNKGLGKPKNAASGLLELAKHATRGGPKDLSARMDEYLYGGE